MTVADLCASLVGVLGGLGERILRIRNVSRKARKGREAEGILTFCLTAMP